MDKENSLRCVVNFNVVEIYNSSFMGESLWIGCCHCPKLLPDNVKHLEYFVGKSVRTHYWNKMSSLIETLNPKLEGRKALMSYEEMRGNGIKPDQSILLSALKACISSKDLYSARKIHAAVIGTGDESKIVTANTLVHMYFKFGSNLDACRVFDRMLHYNVVSWNVMIFGYIEIGESELALNLFVCMQDKGFKPDARTYVGALKACADCAEKEAGKQVGGKLMKIEWLERGMDIHSQLAKCDHELSIYVANTILDMYVKCGSMMHAHWVFSKMQHHDVVSWNAVIFGYIESGESELPLQLFAQMHNEGFTPDGLTYVAALRACGSCAARGGKQLWTSARIESLERGIAIHSELAKRENELDAFVASTLVDMYSKCGSMAHARLVFDRMPHYNLVSWNAVIYGYAEGGEPDLALKLFTDMQNKGFIPDVQTYIAALKACASCAVEEEGKRNAGGSVKVKHLEKGVAMHSQLAKGGFELDILVASTLVDMYAKCGNMVKAHLIFGKILYPDVVSWSALIFGYVESRECMLALQLFACMQDEGFCPNALTYVAALKACSVCTPKDANQVLRKLVKIECLEKGLAIHSQLAKYGYEQDIFVASTLVSMYARCENMMYARMVFDKILYHNVMSWNALITGYAENGHGELALQLFVRMQDEDFKPNARIYVAALQACTGSGEKEDDKLIEGKLVKTEYLERGISIHSQLAKVGYIVDIFVASTLVDMYAKCGCMDYARRVFDMAQCSNVVLWNALMFGYADGEECNLALQLFARIQDEGLMPDALTYVAALKACGSLAALDTGKKIHIKISTDELQKVGIVANTLVFFYGKCGSMLDAEKVFDSMSTRDRDVVAWNSLLAGYSHQGDANSVFELFERMHRECSHVDGFTLLSVLTVCSHVGLVGKGLEYFQAMCLHFMIVPSIEHYACMVDLLSRANHIHEALLVIKGMPFQPNLRIWGTLLSSCRQWKNMAVGQLAFESIQELNNVDASAYILMANIFAVSGMKGCKNFEEK